MASASASEISNKDLKDPEKYGKKNVLFIFLHSYIIE